MVGIIDLEREQHFTFAGKMSSDKESTIPETSNKKRAIGLQIVPLFLSKPSTIEFERPHEPITLSMDIIACTVLQL